MKLNRLLITLAAIFCTMVLAGCSGPAFSAPIRWGEGELVSHTEVIEDPITVEFHPEGTGQVKNFPNGEFVESELGGFCIQDSGQRYTGSATWSPLGKNNVEIVIAGTKYLLSDGGSKFGGQTWGELRFAKCEKSFTFWHLQVECGDPGPNYAGQNLPACRTP